MHDKRYAVEMPELQEQLREIFAQRQQNGQTTAEQDATAAAQWCGCLHSSFYGANAAVRGVNKFLELETTLTQLFSLLSSQSSNAFWSFAAIVVLHLAQEETQPHQREADKIISSNGFEVADVRKKKKKKKTQPNAPLAFMVVNALRKLAEDNQQKRSCHNQGQTNATLRAFCLQGLENPTLVDQKLVVEVLDLFGITDVQPQAVQQAVESLLASKKYTALIKLLTIFRSTLDWSFPSTIKTMTRSKDWSAAELLARTFGGPDDKELARILVDEAIETQDVKRAHRIVYNFGLREEYPDIDLMYCHDGLMKLIERQRWQMALSFAGNDTSLLKLLLHHVVAAGETQWAARLGDILKIPEIEGLCAQMGTQRSSSRRGRLTYSGNAAALNGWLSLGLGGEAIVFCNTEEALRAAMDHFLIRNPILIEGTGDDAVGANNTRFYNDQIVGLDVEWKPISSKIAATTGSTTTTAVASILQIASSTRVFIVDLLALHGNDFLFNTFLQRLFSSTSLLKVGFGFDSDLKVLHQTFPERPSLLRISPFLELSTVVSKLLNVSLGNSLSNATSTILGSPLEKKMQMSNWDTRPLTPDQLTYAALDAYCLVQMSQKLRRGEDDDLPTWQETTALIHDHVYTSPLDAENTADAIEMREKYYQDWVNGDASYGDGAAELLTALDIEEYWEKRKLAYRLQDMELPKRGVDDEVVLDTALEFLDTQAVKSLLEPARGHDPSFSVAVNTICFFADEAPCVACIEANCKLDTAQLATLCGVSRRRIKFATFSECCESFGFEPGTIPPFGHRSGETIPPIKIYANSTLRHIQYLICGGGAHDSLLWLSSKAYFALIEVEAVGDIQRGFSAIEASISKEEVGISASETTSIAYKNMGYNSEYKFLADSMVARVGKWLRTIGMDVLIWDPYAVPKKKASQDHKAALLALSVCEQRILLTRDKKLANRRDAGACFVVSSDDPFQQFQEIKTHFALKLVKDEMMSRCSRCNAKGFDVVDLEYVRSQTEDEVHPNVLEVVTEFWVCRVCHKIYWEGPKYDSNYANLLRMFDEESIVGSDSEDATAHISPV